MNKDLIYTILFLCLLWFLSNKTEGFTIDLSHLTDITGGGDVQYSGLTGRHCDPPTDSEKYVIDGTWNNPLLNTRSDSFNLHQPNGPQITECTGNYEHLVREGDFSATPCQSSGQSYSLTGCTPKCTPPTGELQGDALDLYDIDGASIEYMSKGDGVNPNVQAVLGGGLCQNGNYKVQEATCFSKVNGHIMSQYTTGDACTGARGYWYDPTDDSKPEGQHGDRMEGNVLQYCNPTDGGEILLFGCEPGCTERAEIPSTESIFQRDAGGDAVAVANDPYLIQYGQVANPVDFHLSFTCRDGFSNRGGDQALTCNPLTDNEDDRNYVVSGCFPTCPEGKECVSISNVYDSVSSNIPISFEDMQSKISDLYGPALVDPATGLAIPSPRNQATAVRNLEQSLHYVRTYRIPTSVNGDEQTGVEIQFQCDYNEDATAVSSGCNLVGTGIGDITEFEETSESAWYAGDQGENCSEVCTTHSTAERLLSCQDGNWGVHDEATLRASIGEAPNMGDPDAECPGGFQVTGQPTAPFIITSGNPRCMYNVTSNQRNTCLERVGNGQKLLCKCV
jgi:hypothetical protein